METKQKIRQKPNQKITVRKDGTIDIGTVNDEPSLTQQQFKESCDINNIMKTYSQTGELPLSQKVGQFMDVSNVVDYQEALETVFQAQKAFDNLPSAVRSKFENDPQQLIAFLEDDKNYEEAQKLGLIQIKEKQNDQTNQSPQKTEVQQN